MAEGAGASRMSDFIYGSCRLFLHDNRAVSRKKQEEREGDIVSLLFGRRHLAGPAEDYVMQNKSGLPAGQTQNRPL